MKEQIVASPLWLIYAVSYGYLIVCDFCDIQIPLLG